MKIARYARKNKHNDGPYMESHEIPMDTVESACKHIKCAIDDLCRSDDDTIKESVANLGVVLLDLRSCRQ